MNSKAIVIIGVVGPSLVYIFGKSFLPKLRKVAANILRQKRLLMVTILLAFCYNGWSQSIDAHQVEVSINTLTKSIKVISDQLDKKIKISNDSLNGLLQTLYVYQDSIKKETGSLQKALDFANESLNKLGAAPAKGEPRESRNIAEQRKDLAAESSRLIGLSKSADLLTIDLTRLIDRISNLKASQFFSGLTNRSVSLFSFSLWIATASEFTAAFNVFVAHLTGLWQQFWQSSKWHLNFSLFLISIVLAFGIMMLPNTSLWKRLKALYEKNSSSSDLEENLQIVVKPFVQSLLAFAAGAVLYWGAIEIGLITSAGKSVGKRIWIGMIILVFIWNYANNIFLSGKTVWGKVMCRVGNERYCRNLFVGVFVLFIIDRIFISGFELAGVGIKLLMAQAIISSLIFSVLIWSFFDSKLWQIVGAVKPKDADTNPDTKATIKPNNIDSLEGKQELIVDIIHFLGRGMAIMILGAVLLEYIRFSDFVFHRSALLVLFLISIYTIRVLAVWGLEQIPYATRHKTPDRNPDDEKEIFNFWLKSALDINLFIFGIPVFFLVLGFDWLDISHWIQLLTSGFKIGAITVSFKNIANGVLIFLLIMIITKWSTSTINKRLEKYTHMDPGIRNSITTLINYSGIFLALLAALPIFGINFSQLALIAGALSVGIGFGLQNIVKDFVSGLILLFERPIKIGDWVVVQSGQGYVKSIGARSTIIQTFDLASVVVPNSELVSSSVKNWFYKNKHGRITINVGVGYGSNPEEVKDILLECANQHPAILNAPEPFVIWDDFGDSSLNFNVRCYLKNYDSSLKTSSELRFAIFKGLKESGISIPFPQMDLHIKKSSEPGKTVPSVEKGGDKKD